MDLENITLQDHKRYIEEEIKRLIHEFERKHGLFICDIDYTHWSEVCIIDNSITNIDRIGDIKLVLS